MRRLAHLVRTVAQFVSGLGNKLRVIDHCECTLAPLLEFWDAPVLEGILGQKKKGERPRGAEMGYLPVAFLTNRIKQVSRQHHFYLFTPQYAAEITTLGSYMNSGSPWSPWFGRNYQSASTGRVLFKVDIQSSYLACT